MTSPLTEFFVGLSWKIDEQSKRKMLDHVDSVGKRIAEMAIAFEAGAIARTQVFETIIGSLDQVYWQAQRTNSTVGQIKALGRAAEEVGGSADSMNAALEGFSRQLRYLEHKPGGAARVLREEGVEQPEGKTNADNLVALVKALRSRYSYTTTVDILTKQWGIPEIAVYAATRPDFEGKLKESQERRRRYGINPDDPEFGKESARLVESKNNFFDSIDAVLYSVAEKLAGPGGEKLDALTKKIDANAGRISDFLVRVGKALMVLADGFIYLIEHQEEWLPVLKDIVNAFKRLGKEINAVVNNTVGWRTALELLIILMIGRRIAAAVGAIGALAAAFAAFFALFGIHAAQASAFGGGGVGATPGGGGGGGTGAVAGGSAATGGGTMLQKLGGVYARTRGAVSRTFGGTGGAKGAISKDYESVGGGEGLKEVMDREAKRAGVDPRILYGIFAGEGLGGYVGDKGTSFGPYQLHYGGSGIPGMNSKGLGDEFTRQTGLDARDPKTIAAQTRWVTNFIARGGSLAHWHGYRGRMDWQPGWDRRRTAGPVPTSGGASPKLPEVDQDKAKFLQGGSRYFDLKGFKTDVPPGGENVWNKSITNSSVRQHLQIDVSGAQDTHAVAQAVAREVSRSHGDMVKSALPRGAKEERTGRAPPGAQPTGAGERSKGNSQALPAIVVDQ